MNRSSWTGLVVLLLLGVSWIPLAGPSAAQAEPSLSILTPRDGEVIGNGTSVIVTFAVANFVLVQPGRVGQANGTTEGHVDIFVDGTYVRLITRVEPVSLPLPSGPHTIRMQLKANNGTALVPDVSESVRVTVTQGPAGGQPTIRILSPSPGEETGHDLYVAVEVTNFALVDPRGQPNAPSEGHVQLSFDGVFQQEPRAYAPGLIVDMADGNHTVTARLVNNDGTPLSPDVFANVTFHVEGAADPTRSAEVTGGISVILAAILVVLLWRRRRAAARIAEEAGSVQGNG